MDRRWNRPGIVAVLATSFTACTALAYVWFGYDPSRASAWLITPATVTLASPGQAVQLHVVEYIPEIRETIKDITASCSFWTDNPEWRLSSNGLLACHVSGQGVVHALFPSGTSITAVITVDPHLPPRILTSPLVPKM